MGLTEKELAFYDALADDSKSLELLGDEILREIAKELLITINNNLTIDWNVREQSRAKIRVMIKRLLKKYDYPPDKIQSATDLVIRQAELICKSEIGE